MVLVFMFIFMRLFSPMDLTIKVLRFTPNQRRPDSRLNRKTACCSGPTPGPFQTGRQWRSALVGPGVFQTTVALNREDGRGFVFTRFRSNPSARHVRAGSVKDATAEADSEFLEDQSEVLHGS